MTSMNKCEVCEFDNAAVKPKLRRSVAHCDECDRDICDECLHEMAVDANDEALTRGSDVNPEEANSYMRKCEESGDVLCPECWNADPDAE